MLPGFCLIHLSKKIYEEGEQVLQAGKLINLLLNVFVLRCQGNIQTSGRPLDLVRKAEDRSEIDISWTVIRIVSIMVVVKTSEWMFLNENVLTGRRGELILRSLPH